METCGTCTRRSTEEALTTNCVATPFVLPSSVIITINSPETGSPKSGSWNSTIKFVESKVPTVSCC